jgi:ferric-dicitrate binding protein FerR (iron transport regulator)
MLFKPGVVVFLSLLLGLQPGPWASSPTIVGQMVTEGAAEVNGARTPKGGTLFVGDHIVTQGGANATLALTGGSQLILIESSSLQMKEVEGQTSASLDRGALAVLSRTATTPIVVEAAGARIHPGKGGAVYAVTVTGEKLEVFSKTGTTEVEAADRTVEVHEGETLDATMAPAAPAPATPAAASPQWTSPAGKRSKFEEVVIIVGVAAAVTALVLAVKAVQKTCTGTPSPFKVTCN